jgi:hypothetical protein
MMMNMELYDDDDHERNRQASGLGMTKFGTKEFMTIGNIITTVQCRPRGTITREKGERKALTKMARGQGTEREGRGVGITKTRKGGDDKDKKRGKKKKKKKKGRRGKRSTKKRTTTRSWSAPPPPLCIATTTREHAQVHTAGGEEQRM